MLFLFMKTTTKGNSDSSSSCDGVGYGEPRNRVAQNGQEDLNPSVAQVSSLIRIANFFSDRHERAARLGGCPGRGVRSPVAAYAPEVARNL